MPRMSNSVAARLAPLSVLDERHDALPLGGFWAGRPVVLGFVRHFG